METIFYETGFMSTPVKAVAAITAKVALVVVVLPLKLELNQLSKLFSNSSKWI